MVPPIDYSALEAAIAPIAKMIDILAAHHGATMYLVGGAVRDLALKRPIKDLDFEVHGIAIETLQKELRMLGPVSLVGKQFGVLKIHGLPYDFSLPRRDSAGRKPIVAIEPNMTITDALRRRDITMNAMAIDLTRPFQLIDPFGGLNDMAAKRIRAVDTALFVEDPLRFYRVMQFSARFEMMPDDTLDTLCKSMKLESVAKERITEELKKMLLQSHRPSIGFRWIQKLGRLNELFPELHQLSATPQRPDFHPEGDVFEHTMQALDAAAAMPLKNDDPTLFFCNNETERLHLLLASLCHDFGKIATTDEQLHAYGHAKAGTPYIKQFFQRFTFGTPAQQAAITLSLNHGKQLAQLLTSRNPEYRLKKLAQDLAPTANIRLLIMVCLADIRGRNRTRNTPLTTTSEDHIMVIKRARQLQISEHPEPPILVGDDLVQLVTPGPTLGEALTKAYEYQIETGIHDKQKLIAAAIKK